MKWILTGVFLVVAVVLAVVSAPGLEDHDLSRFEVTDVQFSDGTNDLAGSFVHSGTNGPVLLLVHGDGPQDRFSDGGYFPLMNGLLDQGISIFSWDKPGVGASSGNWLDQSMDDRSREAAAAARAVRSLYPSKDLTIGTLGFSQAGWVVPKIPIHDKDIAFMVMIGPAINWQRQGEYYARVRQRIAGQNAAATEDVIHKRQQRDAEVFFGEGSYQDYVSGADNNDPLMSEDRYGFVRTNISADATSDIAKLVLPVLVLAGADDLNVDPVETVTTYAKLLEGRNESNEFRIVPDATHGLLDSAVFNFQTSQDWTIAAWLTFLWRGRNAYNDGVIVDLGRWILQFDG